MQNQLTQERKEVMEVFKCCQLLFFRVRVPLMSSHTNRQGDPDEKLSILCRRD